jgi:hypothetical protein
MFTLFTKLLARPVDAAERRAARGGGAAAAALRPASAGRRAAAAAALAPSPAFDGLDPTGFLTRGDGW